MNIAIVGDTHSGVTKHDITGTNIFILQIPITLNGEIKEDFDTISLSKFDKMVYNNYKIECVPPSVKSIKEIWNYLLKVKKYDCIIHIPYSSKLGDTFSLCQTMAQSYEGKVIVLENNRMGVALKALLFTAKKLANKGYEVNDIIDILHSTADEFSLYFTIDNPKYVKNNCKLNMTKEAYNSLSNPKIVLQLENGKIGLKCKSLTKKGAKKLMLKALDRDLKTKFKDYVDRNDIQLFIAYSGRIEDGIALKEYLVRKYPTIDVSYVDQLPICLCSHLGTGVLMVGCSRIFNNIKIVK